MSLRQLLHKHLSGHFLGILIIVLASLDPELNRQSLGFSRNPPEHSRVKICAKPCTPLFGKLPRSTVKSAFAPTFTQTPSWPFSGFSVIFVACRDRELNRQCLGLPANPQQHSRVQVYAKPCTPLFGKLPRSTAKSAFVPTFTQTPLWPFSGTLFIFSACRDPELNRQGLGLPVNRQEHSRIQVCAKPRFFYLKSYYEVPPKVRLRLFFLKHLSGHFLALDCQEIDKNTVLFTLT